MTTEPWNGTADSQFERKMTFIFLQIELAFLFTGILTLGHPGYLFLIAKRAERRHNNNETNDKKENMVYSTRL